MKSAKRRPHANYHKEYHVEVVYYTQLYNEWSINTITCPPFRWCDVEGHLFVWVDTWHLSDNGDWNAQVRFSLATYYHADISWWTSKVNHDSIQWHPDACLMQVVEPCHWPSWFFLLVIIMLIYLGEHPRSIMIPFNGTQCLSDAGGRTLPLAKSDSPLLVISCWYSGGHPKVNHDSFNDTQMPVWCRCRTLPLAQVWFSLVSYYHADISWWTSRSIMIPFNDTQMPVWCRW